ncbi:unnamed protein product [Pleuronectes platessa]|uniref:Uncharacterized protein n=1 Tax=Pleuronectes platessa TaxID=8262 RepID=A0A9N7USV4_PLEPL|nr:unnamed protein product [Pleuronectes platessa]
MIISELFSDSGHDHTSSCVSPAQHLRARGRLLHSTRSRSASSHWRPGERWSRAADHPIRKVLNVSNPRVSAPQGGPLISTLGLRLRASHLQLLITTNSLHIFVCVFSIVSQLFFTTRSLFMPRCMLLPSCDEALTHARDRSVAHIRLLAGSIYLLLSTGPHSDPQTNRPETVYTARDTSGVRVIVRHACYTRGTAPSRSLSQRTRADPPRSRPDHPEQDACRV